MTWRATAISFGCVFLVVASAASATVFEVPLPGLTGGYGGDETVPYSRTDTFNLGFTLSEVQSSSLHLEGNVDLGLVYLMPLDPTPPGMLPLISSGESPGAADARIILEGGTIAIIDQDGPFVLEHSVSLPGTDLSTGEITLSVDFNYYVFMAIYRVVYVRYPAVEVSDAYLRIEGTWTDDGPLGGDADLSGCVDDDDLSLLLSYFNDSTEVWNHGDFTDDGIVDDDDLSVLLANWGQSASPNALTIPEPASLCLFVIAAGLGSLKRRGR